MTVEQIVDEALPLTAFDLNCAKRTAVKKASRARLTKHILNYTQDAVEEVMATKVNSDLDLTGDGIEQMFAGLEGGDL